MSARDDFEDDSENFYEKRDVIFAEIDKLRLENIHFRELLDLAEKEKKELTDDLDHLTDYWREHSCVEEMDGLT